MRITKKLLSILLVAALIMSMTAGCGKKAEAAERKEKTEFSEKGGLFSKVFGKKDKTKDAEK
ncbi:MAG: hypothetical protein K5985_01045 [Lachnospiraceae bacterium]|nr:hypothetical protein [Lachnospiraceae bacterium]